MLPMTNTGERRPPWIVYLLILLFAFGTIMSFLAAVSFLFPKSALNVLWRLNPRGHEGFQQIGTWSFPVLGVIAAACLICFIGLLKRKLWGYWWAFWMILINLVADVLNAMIAKEYRAFFGVPIAFAILWSLSRPGTRAYFREHV
jgi:hypothetical protein